MKIILPIILLACSISWGQESPKPAPETTTELIIPAGETVEHCDAVIKAIDVKVDHVKGDPAENAKALQNGWFDKMARNRAIYVARREYLLNNSNQK